VRITDSAELDNLMSGDCVISTVGIAAWYKRRDGRWMSDDGDVLTSKGLLIYATNTGGGLFLGPSVLPDVETLARVIHKSQTALLWEQELPWWQELYRGTARTTLYYLALARGVPSDTQGAPVGHDVVREGLW
jgi:hypothetical protein